MKLLIIPKPMFDKEMAVTAYCFRFQKSDAILDIQSVNLFDGAMRSPCMEVLCKVGLDAFTNGLPIFVPVNQFTLITDIENQCPISSDKIIFLLDETIPPEESFINSIKRLKALGYRMAIEKVSNYNKMDSIIELCDFIFLHCNTPRFKDIMHILKQRYKHLSFVATEINTLEIFENIKNDNFISFEGVFYSLPITKGKTEISPLKANYIKLLNTVRNEDFDIDDVAKVVGQDTSLTISLLKLINSPYLGLSQKIKTVKHATALLGQKEVRKWVTTAVASQLSSDKPDEITKLSLIRAKFAENLSKHFEMATHAPSLFLMGLFSILDVVLGMSMEESLKIIHVSDKISQALIHRKGDYAKVLEFIYTYETANWIDVSRLVIINNLKSKDVFNAYIDATLWYRSIISASVEDFE